MADRSQSVKIAVLLIVVFFGMEFYQFLPEGDYRHFYPLSPQTEESLQWYAKDIAFRLFALLFTLWAWDRERKNAEVARIVFIFPLFWGLEFVVYLLCHSHRGAINFIIYIPIFIYATYITARKQAASVGEWLYSKIFKNKHGDGR